jgi:glycosyltransferase involved in cell wall biosynthesis
MSGPEVSVVVPTHNRRDLLERALSSALAQRNVELEIIVVDDASSDGTAAFVESLAAADSRVRSIRSETSRGGGASRNAGIESSRGRVVAFLDDDDEWLPGKLERQLALLAANPDAVACSANFEQLFPSGRRRTFTVPHRPSIAAVLYENVLGGASVCACSLDALRAIGGFDARLKSAQDFDLWIRLRQRGAIVACGESLVLYREHAGPRITTRASAPYLGSRRLYFKHRGLMDAGTRRRHLSWLCALKSQQQDRPARARLAYLIRALRLARPRAAISYGARGVLSFLRSDA